METGIDLQFVAGLAKQVGEPKKAGNSLVALVPEGTSLADLTEYQYREAPLHRKKGTVTLFDQASFCGYFGLFADDDSRIFADPTRSIFTAVLDYHESGDGKPRHGEHRAVFTLRNSPEWAAWSGQNTKALPQSEFAEFIEDNAADIIEPLPAHMIEVARDLKAKSEVNFASAIRLQNGQTQFTYQEEIRGSVGKGSMDVPETFRIRIPLHLGGPEYEITARLRYRIRETKLVLWYDLYRVQKLVEAAFRDTVKVIADTTGTAVLMGSV